jgi:adenylylsulfate kinase-like enzyme
MDTEHREALRSLRLEFAPTADDLWHSQGSLHVAGLHDEALADVMAGFGDAERQSDSSPLGVVIRGPAGSGKTHLLGQVRERVQAAGGFFYLVELLDATSFWQSARGGILESLGRPGGERETQLKDVLWRLSSIAHISRAARRAVIGDEDLTPDVLNEFVTAMATARRDPVRQYRHILRALVLLGATDLDLQDIGEAFLLSADLPADASAVWGLPAPTHTPQEVVRAISRLGALAGPAVLGIDQIDTLLAQSATQATTAENPTDNRDLEHVAHGLLSIREAMRRTVEVVACLPSVWELISDRAPAPVQDRFRVSATLQGLPSADIGRAILERRFSASYRAIGFTPPYPSWPILPSAFEDAPNYTPRQLLKKADAHIRACLKNDAVEELATLTGEAPATTPVEPVVAQLDDLHELDSRFAEYRRRAIVEPALDPVGEDTTMPGLLSAALDAWIVERGDKETIFWLDPPPGKHIALHGRLRQSVNPTIDDERHWAFRAIAATNASAAQSRIKKAWDATGMRSNPDKRQLVLLRNTPWPSGAKTAALVADFEEAGGRTLLLADDDLRTICALRDLIDDHHHELPQWLRLRQPAHGIKLLREALADVAGDVPPPVTEPEPAVTPTTEPDVEDVPDPVVDSATAVPLGADETSSQLVAVELAELRKHAVIFAGSGSGKTVLIRRIVEECALRGVSSIVLDINNDLSRLGSAWPERPQGWVEGDNARAADYLGNAEVVIWTPNKLNGRPLSFQPLPDFASVVDDEDEFGEAVDSAVAALEPRALISGTAAKREHSRAVLRQALETYGRQPSTTLPGFVAFLSDLPPDVSDLAKASTLAAELAQNLRAAMVNDRMFAAPAHRPTLACC